MVDKNEPSPVPSLNDAKVIIVIGPLDLGGAERQAILLARYLINEENSRVEIWGIGGPGRVSELCDRYGITWRSMGIPVIWHPNTLKQVFRMLRFALVLRRAKVDVIVPFMFHQSVVCGIIWRLTGARACVWNQRDEGGRYRLVRWAETLAVRATPYFIANSSHGGNFLTEKLGVPPDRVRVVHNGVEASAAERDRAAWRSDLGLSDCCFVACMVANLQGFKDHATLLKAWRIVVDHLKGLNRDAVLLLAGRFDTTHDTLKALAFDLDLGKTVRFLGPVQDISGLLKAVDLGIHSSVNEGCPNGVLECMAAGLSLAGTDDPGIREAVGPPGFRFLANPKDPQDLANQIITLMLNPELRRVAGEWNRQRVEAEFSPHVMKDRIVSVIRETMSRGQGSRIREQ